MLLLLSYCTSAAKALTPIGVSKMMQSGHWGLVPDVFAGIFSGCSFVLLIAESIA